MVFESNQKASISVAVTSGVGMGAILSLTGPHKIF